MPAPHWQEDPPIHWRGSPARRTRRALMDYRYGPFRE
jgi:hypothetical protein